MKGSQLEVKVLLTDPHDSTLYAKGSVLGLRKRNEER